MRLLLIEFRIFFVSFWFLTATSDDVGEVVMFEVIIIVIFIFFLDIRFICYIGLDFYLFCNFFFLKKIIFKKFLFETKGKTFEEI